MRPGGLLICRLPGPHRQRNRLKCFADRSRRCRMHATESDIFFRVALHTNSAYAGYLQVSLGAAITGRDLACVASGVCTRPPCARSLSLDTAVEHCHERTGLYRCRPPHSHRRLPGRTQPVDRPAARCRGRAGRDQRLGPVGRADRRNHSGLRADGRHRPGAGPSGRARRRRAAEGSGDHHQQDVRLRA